MAPDELKETIAKLARGLRRTSPQRQEKALDVSPSSAFEVMVQERLRNLEAKLGEVNGRVNGLIFAVVGSVVLQVVMRLAGLG